MKKTPQLIKVLNLLTNLLKAFTPNLIRVPLPLKVLIFLLTRVITLMQTKFKEKEKHSSRHKGLTNKF